MGIKIKLLIVFCAFLFGFHSRLRKMVKSASGLTRSIMGINWHRGGATFSFGVKCERVRIFWHHEPVFVSWA